MSVEALECLAECDLGCGVQEPGVPWADMDHHPAGTTISVVATWTTPVPRAILAQAPPEPRPVFAISDLHVSDGGPRDNFAYGGREKEFAAFLDFVEDNRGRLVICGDLFEPWQANVSKVLATRQKILDRLARMRASIL